MAAPDAQPSYAQKLRGSEYLCAIASIVLFMTTFSAWFNLPSVADLKNIAPDAVLEGGLVSGESIALNVWDLPIGRWFVYLSILCAAWMVLAAVFSANPEWAVILATPTVIFSFFTMLILSYRLIDPPREAADPTTVYYVAVGASVALFAGAFWAIRDEFVPPGFKKAPAPEVVHLDSAP